MLKKVFGFLALSLALTPPAAAQIDPSARGLAVRARLVTQQSETNAKLLRAAATAVNSFSVAPLNPAVPWASNTAYRQGEIAVNWGQQYITNNSCTSASSGTGPNHLSGSYIYDGASNTGCPWTWMGAANASTADANAPLVFVSSSASPVAYANSTALTAGQMIFTTPSGNSLARQAYYVTAPGTTAASGTGPSATSGNITDGTATLVFAGYYSNNLSNLYKTNPSGAGTSGYLPGEIATRGSYWANSSGSTVLYTYTSNGSSSVTGAHTSFAWRTRAQTQILAINFQGSTNQIEIDGRRYSPSGLKALNGNSYIWISWPQGASREHEYRFFLGNTQSFSQLTVSAYDQIVAPPTLTRGVTLADSLCAGSTYHGYLSGGAYPTRIGEGLGIDDMWDICQGSTGVLANNGGNGLTFGQRLAEYFTRGLSTDLVILQTSGNDSAYTSAQRQAAWQALVQQAMTGAPNAVIVVLGQWPTNSYGTGAGVWEDDAKAGTIAAAGSALGKRVFFLPIYRDPILAWIADGTNRGVHGGQAQVTYCTTPTDGIHETIGCEAYMAERVVAEIKRQVYPVLTVQPIN